MTEVELVCLAALLAFGGFRKGTVVGYKNILESPETLEWHVYRHTSTEDLSLLPRDIPGTEQCVRRPLAKAPLSFPQAGWRVLLCPIPCTGVLSCAPFPVLEGPPVP